MTSSSQGSLRFVLFATAVTAIGGFLFGYDTAVINGANTFLQAHFELDPQRDSLLIGLATASAILGCIPGAMSAGFISDRFGRRRVLFFCALLYAVSGILSAIPQTFRPVHRRPGTQRHCHRRVLHDLPGLHRGNRAAAVARAARLAVPTGHRDRDFCDAVHQRMDSAPCAMPPGTRPSAGAGCWLLRRFPRSCSSRCCSPFPKARAG